MQANQVEGEKKMDTGKPDSSRAMSIEVLHVAGWHWKGQIASRRQRGKVRFLEMWLPHMMCPEEGHINPDLVLAIPAKTSLHTKPGGGQGLVKMPVDICCVEGDADVGKPPEVQREGA
ncbi:hypothetical protein JX265_012124 [Neoarthrinium moseri]|uniref:Uncharacterized protein n=1 Tax=Neoarthrinium moseri TaxID=1658444 RepID=A0A9P9WB55_9PEZI|nr:hypothetical protein JX266_004810 [Neoarthrinium moseri]KAI1855861.1 hypothetical protein JX265_012124 [Neoarthrinium moseri]